MTSTAAEALDEYRARIKEEDPAVIKLQQTDPFVVASIFGQGFEAGREARALRVVSTVAELDALPVGSVVMKWPHPAMQIIGPERKMYAVGSEDFMWIPETEMLGYFPLTVLWVGGTE